jgi:hypothetical protein
VSCWWHYYFIHSHVFIVIIICLLCLGVIITFDSSCWLPWIQICDRIESLVMNCVSTWHGVHKMKEKANLSGIYKFSFSLVPFSYVQMLTWNKWKPKTILRKKFNLSCSHSTSFPPVSSAHRNQVEVLHLCALCVLSQTLLIHVPGLSHWLLHVSSLLMPEIYMTKLWALVWWQRAHI